MFRLRTLGTFGLSDPTGADTSLAPHRLALLALLAAAGDRGMARDKVLAYLWPESTPSKARAALEQMLHAVRVSLGDRSTLLGNPLRLDPAIVSSDVGEFRVALDTGQLERAVELYEGAFLDGFYLSSFPEFEEWVESERSRLAAQYTAALESLATQAESLEDHARVIRWLRALGSVVPLNGLNARNLMQALAALGNREGTLDFAAQYSARVRAELGVEPDPRVTALAEELRSASRGPRNRQQTQDTPADAVGNGLPAPPTLEQSPISRATPVRTSRRARSLIAAGALLLLASFGAVWWRRGATHSNESRLKAVALLPCESLGPEPNEEHVGDRWTEELIRKLFRIGELRPRSWLSVERYRNTGKSSREIGAELNAGALVRCHVAEQSSGIRLALELVRVDDDQVIWSRVFDDSAGVGHMNSVQWAAADGIARALGVVDLQRPTQGVGRPLTNDTAALRLFRIGRYLLDKRDFGPELQKSVGYFRAAIARDSSFARALVGLADALSDLASTGRVTAREVYPEIGRLLLKAIALDGTMADAHTMLGFYLLDYTHDWIGAEQQYRLAIQLNPSSRDAHLWFGHFLLTAERSGEAITEFERALELDPASAFVRGHFARALIYAGQDDRAMLQVQQASELEPDWVARVHLLAMILLRRGLADSALAVLRTREPTIPDLPLYVAAGRRDIAQRILDSLTSPARKQEADPAYLAMVQVALGQKVEALASLEEAYKTRSSNLLFVLGPAPFLDALRGEPRFRALRAQAGFSR